MPRQQTCEDVLQPQPMKIADLKAILVVVGLPYLRGRKKARGHRNTFDLDHVAYHRTYKPILIPHPSHGTSPCYVAEW